jgi:hypothetical protein
MSSCIECEYIDWNETGLIQGNINTGHIAEMVKTLGFSGDKKLSVLMRPCCFSND